MAGHSKWANIRHRKGRQDAKRAKIFTQISKEITISAKDGGGDADMNPRLRLAIRNAKAQSMPNDTIAKAIKKGTGELDGGNLEENTYEGYGPNGVAVIVETVSDNKNRTVSQVRATFGRNNGNMGETNSVSWNFSRKGVIEIKTNNRLEEEIFEIVVEAGAEDLEYGDETCRIITSMEDYGSVNNFLESKSDIDIEKSQLEYIPNDKLIIDSADKAKRIMKFFDAMEDLDDVQNVYSNFEIDDSIAESIDY